MTDSISPASPSDPQPLAASAEDSRTTAAAVWLFSGDLLFASRIESAAARAQRPFKLLGQWPADAAAESLPSPGWVIVDLATRFGASADVIANCRAVFPQAETIAFGPHVQPQRLAQARANGFAQVLTRGRFDALLPELFTS